MTETTETTTSQTREYVVRGKGYVPSNGEWVGIRVIARKTNPDNLRTASEHGSKAIRTAVAHNIYTPKDVLDALAHDAEPSVRRGVAGNKAASAATLAWLAEDDSPEVRAALGENPSTPFDILIKVADDVDPERLRGVAKYCEDALFRAKAKAAMAEPEPEPAEGGSVWTGRGGYTQDMTDTLIAIARNPKTPGSVLKRLAARREAEIRIPAKREMKRRLDLFEDDCLNELEKLEAYLAAKHMSHERSSADGEGDMVDVFDADGFPIWFAVMHPEDGLLMVVGELIDPEDRDESFEVCLTARDVIRRIEGQD